MMNVVSVGNKVVEMFKIEEYTAEAFEKAMKAAGWECEENGFLIHKTVVKYGNGFEMEEVDSRVDPSSVCVEQEMKYAEYKANYSGCRTKKDSYNKETKTIIVYVQ